MLAVEGPTLVSVRSGRGPGGVVVVVFGVGAVVVVVVVVGGGWPPTVMLALALGGWWEPSSAAAAVAVLVTVVSTRLGASAYATLTVAWLDGRSSATEQVTTWPVAWQLA